MSLRSKKSQESSMSMQSHCDICASRAKSAAGDPETETYGGGPVCDWSEASIAERERMYLMHKAYASRYGLVLPPATDSCTWIHLLENELFYVYPREHKAKIVVWADLTLDDVDRLNESPKADHNKELLAHIFHLDDWKEDSKQAIIMDLYYYTLQFCRDNNFSRDKISAFFSMIKKTHEVAIETPFGNMEQAFRYFKELILCHSFDRPPYRIQLFTVDEVRKLTEYALLTYFRHFKMYKYAFTALVRLDLSINYHGVPVFSPEPTEIGDDLEEDLNKDLESATEQIEGEAEPEKKEESEERKELRVMIQGYLAEEIRKVKVTVEEQIRDTEDTIAKKIEVAENYGKKTPKKSKKKKEK